MPSSALALRASERPIEPTPEYRSQMTGAGAAPGAAPGRGAVTSWMARPYRTSVWRVLVWKNAFRDILRVIPATFPRR